MNLPYRLRQSLTVLVLVCILAVTSACNSATDRAPQASAPSSIKWMGHK